MIEQRQNCNGIVRQRKVHIDGKFVVRTDTVNRRIYYGARMDMCWDRWLAMMDGNAYQMECQHTNKDTNGPALQTSRAQKNMLSRIVHNFYFVNEGKSFDL